MAKDFAIINGLYSGDLANRVASHFGKKILTVKRQYYPNGCRFHQIVESVRGQNVYIFQTQNSPEADVCVMEAARLINSVYQSSAAMIVLIMPSALYAQSDGEDQAHVPVTLKITAQFLESQCHNIPFKVVWVDGHSKALTTAWRSAVFDPLSARYLFADYIENEIGLDDLGLVATDTNLARVKRLQKVTGIQEMYYFDKDHEDNSGRTKTGRINRPLVSRRVVLFDDIVGSGGSMKGPIKALVRAGVEEIYLLVTHTYHGKDFLDFITDIPQVKKFIFTDSVPVPKELKSDKTHVINLEDLFSRYIDCIQNLRPVSPLIKENDH